jgi:hypothetical protein
MFMQKVAASTANVLQQTDKAHDGKQAAEHVATGRKQVVSTVWRNNQAQVQKRGLPTQS